MIYGTCVDISIELEGETYYIPAIIVDIKAHTYPSGVIQTYVNYAGEEERSGNAQNGNIVEWYVEQFENADTKEGNKSSGLAQFNNNASIIIYQEEVLQ